MVEEKLVNQSVTSDVNPGIENRNSGKKHSKFRNRTHRQGKRLQNKPTDVTPLDSSDNKTQPPIGLNVFYKGGVRFLGNRHKYAISHYEVDLHPQTLGTTADDLVVPALTDLHTCPLGGPEFRIKVEEAARKACAVNVNYVPNMEHLINAFYKCFFNSRQMYALLLTAWRCQQMINTIDEDGKYLNPLLSDHALKELTKGWSNTSLATETNYSTFANTPNRNAMCFSTGTSKGIWDNQILTPVLTHAMLPKGTREWLESMFSQVHVVQPTDFSMSPRMVVFWPDGILVPATGTTLINFADYMNYGSHGAATYYTSANTTIAQLITHINSFVSEMYTLEDQWPQIKLMYDMLGFTTSSFNFSRDLDGLHVPLNKSFDVSKLISSVAYPAYQKESAVTGVAVKYDIYSSDLVIERDPEVVIQDIQTLSSEETSSGKVNLVYRDRLFTSNEVSYAYLQYCVRPLSLVLLIANVSNTHYRWELPLCSYFNKQASVFGGFTTSDNATAALLELSGINGQQGPVLSRYRLNAQIATQSDLNAAGIYVNGIDGTTYTVPFYDLKDYLVSDLTAQAWRQTFADSITC